MGTSNRIALQQLAQQRDIAAMLNAVLEDTKAIREAVEPSPSQQ